MAIYTNEHLTDLLNDEYEKVRKLEQELQRLKSTFAGYENFQMEKQLKQELQATREQLEKAEKVIKYYSDGDAFNPDYDSLREELDSDFSDEKQMSFKGKRARQYFKQKDEVRE